MAFAVTLLNKSDSTLKPGVCLHRYQDGALIEHHFNLQPVNILWEREHFHFLLRDSYADMNLALVIRKMIPTTVDAKQFDYWKPLQVLYRLIIDKNIDVNATTSYGWNALHLVSSHYKENSLIEIIRLLIDNKVEVNAKTPDGLSALLLVCCHYRHDNLIDIIEVIILVYNYECNFFFNVFIAMCSCC